MEVPAPAQEIASLMTSLCELCPERDWQALYEELLESVSEDKELGSDYIISTLRQAKYYVEKGDDEVIELICPHETEED